MSRKSRHVKSKVYVKCVEHLDVDELNKSMALKSVIDAIRACDGNSLAWGFRLNSVGEDGELKSRRFRSVTWGKNSLNMEFSASDALEAVRLLFSDGTIDYGFKYEVDGSIVHRKNSILEPIYAKDGIWSEDRQRFVECPKEVESMRTVPAWMARRLPMYNERIRDVSRADSVDDEFRQFRNALCQVMDSRMVSHSATFGTPPVGLMGSNAKVAWKLEAAPKKDKDYFASWVKEHQYFSSHSHLDGTEYHYYVAHKDDDTTEYVHMPFDADAKQAVYLYRYIKSIYRNHVTKRKVYGVVPMGCVLNVERLGSYREPEDAVEIWNNLDEACKGNV